MPEGPSIVILKEQAARFAGQVVREVSGNSRQPLQRMQGLRVEDVCSWGKHFLLPFDGFALRIHFLLFGSYRIDDPKEGVAPRVRLRFDERPHVIAADALLDQDLFAGVGNIIKNEVLFRIRVHPESEIGALPPRKLAELVKQAREYSFDFLAWKKAYVLRKHYQVHTKTHCPRDGTRLTYRKHLGRAQRRAFFCEACQKLYGGGATTARAPSRRTR
jgi:endonuclease-8